MLKLFQASNLVNVELYSHLRFKLNDLISHTNTHIKVYEIIAGDLFKSYLWRIFT